MDDARGKKAVQESWDEEKNIVSSTWISKDEVVVIPCATIILKFTGNLVISVQMVEMESGMLTTGKMALPQLTSEIKEVDTDWKTYC